MDGNVSFKKGLTARELKRNARRREITKRGKEDKAKAKAQGEPSSRPRCLGALRSPENSESTKRKKKAKSLATKKPRMDNPDNSVSSPSANVFSTALESDITQLDDRFDVSRQEKLAQSGEQLLKMIVDVATIFNDIPSSCYPENEIAKGASWAERMENMDSLWEGVRESVYNNFLSKQAYPLVIQCDNCSQSLSGGRAIRCLTCKKHYCGDCDFSFHAQQPFHNRWLVSSDSWYSLKTMEFVDSTGKLVEKDVPVPCFKPHQCTLCGSPAVHIESGSRVVIVVTSEGRFECKSSIFSCLECHAKVDATIHEYVQSNFMPGNPKALNFLYSVEVLRLWYLIKHNLPSSSEKKFLECLEGLSEDTRRRGSINRSQFSRASKEYEFLIYTVEEKIKRHDKTTCKACADDPLSCHIDGNMKLLRWLTAKGLVSKSLYGDAVIASDSDLNDFVAVVDSTEKTKSTSSESCGGSTFKAAKSYSSQRKNLDETGVVMGCCRHGVVQRAVNMFHGETFRHTNFIHKHMAEKNFKFISSDVICRYWDFSVRMAAKHPELLAKTKQTKPFLPRMHAKAHVLHCQILWIGHWMDNAALTTGEEQEQVFSKMSRYNSVTKHMGKANRNDHLTAGIMFWNSEKEGVMAKLLMRRRNKAISLLRSSKLNLKKLLEEKQISLEALPSLELDLKSVARKCLAEERSRTGTLSVTKLKLESSYVHMKNLQVKVKKVATSSIERKKFRQAETLVKKRAAELITKMNAFKKSGGKSYELTMQDFEQGYFPWLLVEGSWREEISFYKSFKISDDLPLFSAQEHLNKVSLVCRLLTEKIERSTRRTIAADGDSFEKVRESISVDVDTVVRNNENNEKQDEYQESLKTMNKASEILLGFINNRSALTLTHADVLVGIFPWNKPEISFMEKFNIVDTWKLWQRSQEEIVQSEKEMTQFMKSLYDMRIKLQEDRQMYLQDLSGSSLQQLELQSKANIVLLEINRLANTLENAISSFRRDSTLSVIIDACADLENDKESVIQYNELEEDDDESDYESSSEDEDD